MHPLVTLIPRHIPILTFRLFLSHFTQSLYASAGLAKLRNGAAPGLDSLEPWGLGGAVVALSQLQVTQNSARSMC